MPFFFQLIRRKGKPFFEFFARVGYNLAVQEMRSHRRRFAALTVLLSGPLVLTPACAPKQTAGREVWAEVDGHPVYREQAERIYRSRVASGSYRANPDQALNFKLSILNELINNQILVDHAARAHIAVSEGEVDTKLAELESPYGKDEFQKKLGEQGVDPGDLRQQVRQSLIINKLINKEIISRISVSDAEIAEYYERNKASFNVPETEYHLAQIEVNLKPDAPVRNLKNDKTSTPAEAERKIQALDARLRAGDDFAAVAQQYSEDPRTAAGGGDMGFIPKSSLDSSPALKAAVGALKVGQISGIIRSASGFHIIKLLGREEPGQRDVSDPRQQSAVRQTLINEKEEVLNAAYIEDLRNHVKVVNYLAQKIVEAGGNPAAAN